MKELEIFKKKLIYRSNYRGTKEMDILLSKFVKRYIDKFNKDQLYELDKFLDFEDETILKYYQQGIVEKNIDQNKISKIFKNYSV
tara:strand:- start:42 stop:296 length:255 start_codon:yes stop_codon:yes gene_type:complete